MRKSINGLAPVVADTLGHDPANPHWFVVCMHGCNRLKILHWILTVSGCIAGGLNKSIFAGQGWRRRAGGGGAGAPLALADRWAAAAERDCPPANEAARNVLKIVSKTCS